MPVPNALTRKVALFPDASCLRVEGAKGAV